MSAANFQQRPSDILEERVDSTTLLADRLESWRHAAATILDYADQEYSIQASISGHLSKQRRAVSTIPEFVIPEENISTAHGTHSSKASESSITKSFQVLVQQTDNLLRESENVAQSIKTSVIPPLETLHSDLDKHHKTLRSQGQRALRDIEKSREQTVKALESLGKSTASGTYNKVEPRNDPYVLHRRVRATAAEQIHRENQLSESNLNTQNNFGSLEQHTIEVLQNAIAQLDELRQHYYSAGSDSSKVVANVFTKVQSRSEWSQFIEQHQSRLVPTAGFQRDPARVTFANSDHPTTKPIIQGVLIRKGTVLKGKKQGYYVLTEAGYLHEFKSGDYLEDISPELSLFIPEAQLGGVPPVNSGDLSFKISSKDAGKVLGTRHKYTFIASNYDELLAWHQALSRVAGVTDGELEGEDDSLEGVPTALPVEPAERAHDLENMSSRDVDARSGPAVSSKAPIANQTTTTATGLPAPNSDNSAALVDTATTSYVEKESTKHAASLEASSATPALGSTIPAVLTPPVSKQNHDGGINSKDAEASLPQGAYALANSNTNTTASNLGGISEAGFALPRNGLNNYSVPTGKAPLPNATPIETSATKGLPSNESTTDEIPLEQSQFKATKINTDPDLDSYEQPLTGETALDEGAGSGGVGNHSDKSPKLGNGDKFTDTSKDIDTNHADQHSSQIASLGLGGSVASSALNSNSKKTEGVNHKESNLPHYQISTNEDGTLRADRVDAASDAMVLNKLTENNVKKSANKQNRETEIFKDEKLDCNAQNSSHTHHRHNHEQGVERSGESNDISTPVSSEPFAALYPSSAVDNAIKGKPPVQKELDTLRTREESTTDNHYAPSLETNKSVLTTVVPDQVTGPTGLNATSASNAPGTHEFVTNSSKTPDFSKVSARDVTYSTPSTSAVPNISAGQINPLLGSTTEFDAPTSHNTEAHQQHGSNTSAFSNDTGSRLDPLSSRYEPVESHLGHAKSYPGFEDAQERAEVPSESSNKSDHGLTAEIKEAGLHNAVTQAPNDSKAQHYSDLAKEAKGGDYSGVAKEVPHGSEAQHYSGIAKEAKGGDYSGVAKEAPHGSEAQPYSGIAKEAKGGDYSGVAKEVPHGSEAQHYAETAKEAKGGDYSGVAKEVPHGSEAQHYSEVATSGNLESELTGSAEKKADKSTGGKLNIGKKLAKVFK